MLDGDEAPAVEIHVEAVEGEQSAEEQAKELAEAVETVADASVEIARIEADRDIVLAEIDADRAADFNASMVEEEKIRAEAEQEEHDEWRQNIENKLDLITKRLDLLTSPPSMPVEQPLTENLSEESVAVLEEAETPPEPPARPKRPRWI